VTDEAIALLAPRIGTRAACAASGVPQATWYRRHRISPLPPKAAPVPHAGRLQPRALAPAERTAILDALHSDRFADLAPDEIWATLLDEGTYLGSVSTYYRLLREAGESRERRRQATHPAAVKPELIAAGPDQVYSWDITKLHGPAKWTYYHLYVILDIFSRYVVGWMVATRESAALAEKLIAATCAKQGITLGQLTIHADRGSSMTSKPVALLLADLGVTQSHSRPHVSNDNPCSEAQLPGSGQGSHLPAPTDPDVNLSAHPARAVQSFGQYRSAQCVNSRGASFRTSFSHSRALLSLRSSRLYFRRAQRIR
jgi:putative transposase